MKKGGLPLLLIFTLFIGILIGMFVGRQMGAVYVLTSTAQTEPESNHTTSASESALNAEPGKININTASISLLNSLPNIGDVIAQRIIDYREENGDYSVVDDLLMVEGIGPNRLENIRPYITVGG